MFEVKISPIHGRGLFATQFIPAGTILGDLEGYNVEEDGPYVLWVDGVQGFCVTNDFKYINHNNDANSAYYDDLTVVTLKDIYPTDEITHDYRGDDKSPENEMSFEETLEPA
ncbi:MAG TPA: SET domain-containing protein-lysine N-methyltransferase [Phycisphaerales bacterium]|nr:SET domain-containing protein-lysine N-methyltransferase [Phycisphaerales bacterium]HCD32984.1 SET domain-containing protein-lysine N-methyltransferase [Phycisphaerales bacterium]|tara:strand:- start:1801 stop:2136 length:336 start_codon:yes stop_codon:yes gene_type:complete